MAKLLCIVAGICPATHYAAAWRGQRNYIGVLTKRSLAAVLVSLFFLAACAPPKPTTPALTPEGAAELLHYNPKAETWLTYVKKQNAACEYKLDLPDQTSQPASIDLDHIVVCANRPSPKEFDASVSFVFDKGSQKWTVSRFSS